MPQYHDNMLPVQPEMTQPEEVSPQDAPTAEEQLNQPPVDPRYREAQSLDKLLALGPHNAPFYDALVKAAAENPDRPVKIGPIGEKIGLTKQGAHYIFKLIAPELPRLGLEVPYTERDPRWIKHFGELVVNAHKRHVEQGKRPTADLLAEELGFSPAYMKKVLGRLRAAGQIDSGPDIQERNKQITRLRETMHLGTEEIARQLGLAIHIVGSVLRDEIRSRKAAGLATTSLRVRREWPEEKRRQFEERIVTYRKQNYTNPQIVAALRQELKTDISKGHLQDFIHDLIEKGEVERRHTRISTPVSERTKAIWAVANQHPNLPTAQIRERLKAAGITATSSQIWEARNRGDQEAGQRHQMMSEDEFVKTYEEHYQPLFKYILHRVGDMDAALDITSKIFANAYAQLPRLRKGPDGGYPVSYWLFGTARYETLNYISRQRPNQPTPLSVLEEAGVQFKEVEPEQQPASEIEDPLLAAALNSLSVRQRTVITLHILQGQTMVNVANELQMTERTAYNLLAKGLAILKQHYQLPDET